jgi:hypothetical protein|nr:MAG TPA: hypothetical protein [Caudoviricetes sp.]
MAILSYNFEGCIFDITATAKVEEDIDPEPDEFIKDN